VSFHSYAKETLPRVLPRWLYPSLHNLYLEVKIDRIHRRGCREARRYSGQRGVRLHVGCGEVRKPGWVNIDLFGDCELHLDIRRGLPFDDGSAAVIYGEHFFEHLEYVDEARHFLSEAYRVLEPGGLFSLGVPDAEESLRAYAAGDRGFFQRERELWPPYPDWCDTPMHHVNYTFRYGQQHKYAYDLETLARTLSKAGFQDPQRRPFNPELDSEYRRVCTLYVEARKPA
jgi:predicted SAM-dependent methyltransferase